MMGFKHDCNHENSFLTVFPFYLMDVYQPAVGIYFVSKDFISTKGSRYMKSCINEHFSNFFRWKNWHNPPKTGIHRFTNCLGELIEDRGEI